MEVRHISTYDNFKCIAGACKESCCKGWRIPIDDASVERYQSEGGLLGLRLHLSLTDEEDLPVFNKNSGRCPFLTLKGLCGLQIRKGEDYLSMVCREFPREIRNYGPFVEKSLDLSCIHAATLFLREHREGIPGGIGYLPHEEENRAYRRYGDNEDTAYLAFLEQTRAYWIRQIADTHSIQELEDVLRHLLTVSEGLQEAVSEGRKLTMELVEELSADTGDGVYRQTRLFPFSIMTMNDLINTDFFHARLKWTVPFLYDLCMRYCSEFADDTELAGQEHLEDLSHALMQAYPELFLKYRKYLIHYLLQNWLEIYDDYSFLRWTVYGIIQANMLYLFDLSYWAKHRKLTQDVQAHILAVCARRIRHNDAICRQLFEVVQKRLLKEE